MQSINQFTLKSSVFKVNQIAIKSYVCKLYVLVTKAKVKVFISQAFAFQTCTTLWHLSESLMCSIHLQ